MILPLLKYFCLDKPEFVHEYLNISDSLNMKNVNYARTSSIGMKAPVKQPYQKSTGHKTKRREEKLSGWEHDMKSSHESIVTFEIK